MPVPGDTALYLPGAGVVMEAAKSADDCLKFSHEELSFTTMSTGPSSIKLPADLDLFSPPTDHHLFAAIKIKIFT